MRRIEAWLGEYPWDFVVAQNAALCCKGSASIGKTAVWSYGMGVLVLAVDFAL